MAKYIGRHGAHRSLVGSIAVFVVVALSGYLLMTNLRVNRTTTVTADTAQLVQQRVQQVDKLQAQVKSLSSQITALNGLAGNGSSSTKSREDAGSGTILPAVQGPGVTVTLNDSPLWQNMVGSSGSSININDYVVHQQDVEAVVNALWRGGAESMMIQDQRVLFNSAVICKGNVLMLQGKQYSPPYTISAIGPTNGMIAALNDSPSVRTYQQYVSALGLGWDVQTKAKLNFPDSAALLRTLRYAKVGPAATAKGAQ